MAEILIKDEGNLHKIMEVLEGVANKQDELKRQNDAATAGTADMQATLAKLQARCDELDKQLPRGAKFFQAETPTKTQALYEFGRHITEAWRLKKKGAVSPEFAEYQRLISDGGQVSASGAGTGSVVVPTVTYDKIARIIGETSIIRRIATIIPMATNVMNMPTKGTGPSVYWPNEGVAPTKTSVNLSQKQLTTKTMMALDEITAELQEDSIVALEPFFSQVFAEAVAAEENQQAFSATTPFPFTHGVGDDPAVTIKHFGGSAGSARNTFASVTHQDLVNLMFGVNSKVMNRGVYILSSAGFGAVVGLKDSQNRPIYMTTWSALPGVDSPPDQLSATATVLLGRPCYVTDALQASPENSQLFAIYGDFSRFAFGDRKEMSIDWSDQVYFEAGNLALRVRERIAMAILIPGAFCNLKSAI